MSFYRQIVDFAMRFYLLLLCLGLGLAPLAQAGNDWQDFQKQFVTADGRVIDTGQGGISHSEGQGVGMLLAEAAGDQAAFKRIWEWTHDHLQIRGDALLAWRWTLGEGVTDQNNATDGDLLVAWALVRASNRWQNQAYLRAGLTIAQDLRKTAIRPSSFGSLLLPGLAGFERPDGIVINLSYWIFPALQALSNIDPAPEWDALQQSGLALLSASRFGRWQLPADWVVINGDKLNLAEGFPKHFGYDAIRIPLYLYWAGLASTERLQVYRDYWAFFDGARFLPAWTQLTDDSIDSHGAHGASAGQRAIVSLLQGTKVFPPFPKNEDYYSTALRQFCRLAVLKSGRR